MKTADEILREIEHLAQAERRAWWRWHTALGDLARHREAYLQALQAERQNPPVQSLAAPDQPSDWDDAEHGVTRR